MNKQEYKKIKKKMEIKEKKHFFCKHQKNQPLTVLHFKHMGLIYFKKCDDCKCGAYCKQARGLFQTNYQKNKRKKDKLWFLEQKLNYLESDLFPSEYVNQLDLTSEQKYILKILKKALLNEMKKIKGE